MMSHDEMQNSGIGNGGRDEEWKEWRCEKGVQSMLGCERESVLSCTWRRTRG